MHAVMCVMAWRVGAWPVAVAVAVAALIFSIIIIIIIIILLIFFFLTFKNISSSSSCHTRSRWESIVYDTTWMVQRTPPGENM